MRFVDTNILLYAISRSPKEQRKAAIANDVLEDPDLALSVQVLQEFYVQATHSRRRHRLTHDQAGRLLESFLRFQVKELTVELVRAALATCRRYKLSYWDATIVEAARLSTCETLLSEDLSHGQDYGGVHVQNPFL